MGIRIIRLNQNSTVLSSCLSERSIFLYTNVNKISILLVVKEAFAKYKMRKKDFIKKLLSFDFITKEDRDSLIALQENTPKNAKIEIEVEECEELTDTLIVENY